MIDKRHIETGLMAMNRTVGFTATIGAEMIAQGAITQRGSISPLKHVPDDNFIEQLKERNIQITKELKLTDLKCLSS